MKSAKEPGGLGRTAAGAAIGDAPGARPLESVCQKKVPGDMASTGPAPPQPTLDSPEMLLLRSETATDEKPWLPSEVWLPQCKRGAWGSGVGVGAPIKALFNVGRLPHSCAVCKRGGLTGTKLTQCSRCKLARYCCKAHAKAHWATHKLCCAQLSGLRKPDSREAWARSLVDVRLALAGAEPEAHEDATQLWIHMPRCAVCQDATRPLKRCARCQGAAFCPDHADATHAAADCDAAMLEVACFGMISDMGAPLAIASQSKARGPLPSGWKAYLDMKIWDFEVPEYILALAPPTAMLTEGLSLPLLAVRFLGGARETRPRFDSLVVHVVGAATPELVALHRFRELFAWLDARELRLVFVGPDLRLDGPDPEDTKEVLQPGEPGGDKTPFYFSGHRGAYHDVRPTLPDVLKTPQIVLAQHSGCHDLSLVHSWRPTLDLLLDMDVPCVFTGYNEFEANADAAILDDRGANFLAPPHLNPFRGLRPYSEVPGAKTPFYYVNQYAFCVHGRCSPPAGESAS